MRGGHTCNVEECVHGACVHMGACVQGDMAWQRGRAWMAKRACLGEECKRVVRILLECILVFYYICLVDWNDGRNVRVAALADDDDVEIPVVLPDKSDMFVAYATVPGYR